MIILSSFPACYQYTKLAHQLLQMGINDGQCWYYSIVGCMGDVGDNLNYRLSGTSSSKYPCYDI